MLRMVDGRLEPQRVALFFFNDTATTEIYTLSLHDALPTSPTSTSTTSSPTTPSSSPPPPGSTCWWAARSEEHTSELQSHLNLVCRLLLEKKKTRIHSETGILAVVADQNATEKLGGHRHDVE